MTSTVCHRFVQNAWKKERCSNCFKSKEEHVNLKREAPVSRRPLASSKSRGIMKVTTTPTRRKRAVSFKPDLTEIIGFGGEDWSDRDDSEAEDSPTETSEDDCPSSADEDKDLDKVTKSNTEHNANITATATERRRTFTQLMLGQPQKDSDGKKQTLLVSVTPFGHEETDKIPPRRFNKSVSHIPIAKNKELLTEARPKVVLTSYSKNRDSPDLINNNATKEKDKKELKMDEEVKKPKIDTPKMVPVKKDNTEDKPKKLSDVSNENIDEKLQKDGDQVCEVVETMNETSVLKNKDVLSVTPDEKKPVLENLKCEQIVKSELKVQLSPPTPSPVATVPEEIKEPAATESSEESADSLGAPSESREQAGEPDGRADPDIPCEPPALPRSPPPPLLAPPPRNSFLHGSPRNQTDKPKVPSKPDKPQMVRTSSSDLPPLPIQQQTLPAPPLPQDLSKLSNKRRAPNPPPTTPDDSLPLDPIPLEPYPELPLRPPPLELQLSVEEIASPGPEPSPRKSVSMSTDNLIVLEKSEEKRKDKSRSRFSLKKFLRVGGSGSKNIEKYRLEDVKEKVQPTAKPRLVIVHPLELNGSTIEVTPPLSTTDDGLTMTASFKEVLPPAPPPRNLSEKRTEEPKPPPKSEELLRKQRQHSTTPTKTPSTDNVYANLGEVRSGLAPSKPQRTASMREREALLEQQQIRRKPTLPQENVYERISPPRRHSDESNNGGNKDQRFKPGSFTGSEPDLELYSPCGSYYGNECEISEGGCSRPCRLRSRKGRSIVHKNLEDNYGAVVVANHEALAQVLEHLHQQAVVQPALRGLQTAPVLHWSDFSIVDNAPGVVVGRRAFYHALWGAHHVTLSVCKDQGSMHKHPVGPGSFSLVPVTEFNDLVTGKFVPGVYLTTADQELVVQATVAVLPWMQVDTIQSFGATVKSKNNSPNVEVNRDACFILLQFVNSLKSLQAQGIEEVPLSLSNFILCHDVDRDTHHRLCLLQGFSEEVCRTDEKEKLGSLCQNAAAALEELFPNTKLSILIKTLLKKESAMSLSQVKSILEFSLWGPSDVALGVPIKDRELALQRWLDLERATVLHGLVGTRVQLSVLEECHLLFLVRSSAKMMCEASLLLETNGVS